MNHIINVPKVHFKNQSVFLLEVGMLALLTVNNTIKHFDDTIEYDVSDEMLPAFKLVLERLLGIDLFLECRID